VSGAGAQAGTWQVCRADCATAWLSASAGGGTYDMNVACQSVGYAGYDQEGGTCGDLCGYCGQPGNEFYDGSNGCVAPLACLTVHWRCWR